MSKSVKTAKPQAPARFEPNAFYDKLEIEREENRARFLVSYSFNTRRALELYLDAKRKAQ